MAHALRQVPNANGPFRRAGTFNLTRGHRTNIGLQVDGVSKVIRVRKYGLKIT